MEAATAIRRAFNDGPVYLNTDKPITVTVDGVTRQFLARQKQSARRGCEASIYLSTIKLGRMLPHRPVESIVECYKLNGKNVLEYVGLPRTATPDDLRRFRDAGLSIPNAS